MIYAENGQVAMEQIETYKNRLCAILLDLMMPVMDGFEIEMDDFGAGYSSLNMLSTMPIDALKMDMVFVRNIEHSEKDMHLVELVLDIARYLNVPVVAEGVETERQVALLRDAGCDLVQGYYFSRPVPPEEFEKLLLKEKSIIRGNGK